MEGSGFEETSTTRFLDRGPVSVIIIVSILEVLECLIMIFVIGISWKNYSKAYRKSRSPCHFAITLSLLKKCFVFAGIIVLSTNTIFYVRVLLPWEYDDNLCSLMLRITGSTSYNIGMASVYTYLWARQYFLHSSPVLRSVVPKWLPILSKISFLLMMVAFLLPLVMIWLKDNILAVYRSGYCYHKASSLTLFPSLMVGATLLTQSVYTFLFYATLRIHQKANQKATCYKTSNSRKVALRCLCFAVIAVCTDCVTLLAINTAGSRIPEVYVQLFPRIDLFINLLCMLLCSNNLTKTMNNVANLMMCRANSGLKNNDNWRISKPNSRHCNSPSSVKVTKV